MYFFVFIYLTPIYSAKLDGDLLFYISEAKVVCTAASAFRFKILHVANSVNATRAHLSVVVT